MAIGRTPQQEEGQRNVAPNVVGRRRPFRFREEGTRQPSSDLEAQKGFFNNRRTEAQQERKDLENILKARVSNQLTDSTNEVLDPLLTAQGEEARRMLPKAQEQFRAKADKIIENMDEDTRRLASPIIERFEVDFVGKANRHVGKEVHKMAKVELEKTLANRQDNQIRESGKYIRSGRKASDYYKLMKDVEDGKLKDNETREDLLSLARVLGLKVEGARALAGGHVSETIEKSIDFNLGNSQYHDAKAIFDDMKDMIDPERHDEIQAKLKQFKELNAEDDYFAEALRIRNASNGNAKQENKLVRASAGKDSKRYHGIMKHLEALIGDEKRARVQIKGQFERNMVSQIDTMFKSGQSAQQMKNSFNKNMLGVNGEYRNLVSAGEVKKWHSYISDVAKGKSTVTNGAYFNKAYNLMRDNMDEFRKQYDMESLDARRNLAPEERKFFKSKVDRYDSKVPKTDPIIEGEIMDAIAKVEAVDPDQGSRLRTKYMVLEATGGMKDPNQAISFKRQVDDWYESQPGYWSWFKSAWSSQGAMDYEVQQAMAEGKRYGISFEKAKQERARARAILKKRKKGKEPSDREVSVYIKRKLELEKVK